MKLNCKPGDLAVIVGGLYPQFIGHVVTITGPCPVYPDSWDTDPPKYIRGFRQPMSFTDRTLRPIRDPGEDARDETLSWLDIPTQQGETV